MVLLGSGFYGIVQMLGVMMLGPRTQEVLFGSHMSFALFGLGFRWRWGLSKSGSRSHVVWERGDVVVEMDVMESMWLHCCYCGGVLAEGRIYEACAEV